MKLSSGRKGIMAFENLDEPAITDAVIEPTEVLHDPEALVENDMIELAEVDCEIEQTQDGIVEAEQVADTVEAINVEIEKTVESGEGLSPNVADALRVAVEHFHSRLGYNGKHVFPAMEAFGGKMTKIEATKLALGNNRAMALEARACVSIAQEGIGERIANRWKLFWANEEKLLKRLGEVSKAFDKGVPRTTTIEDPAWGKVLNHKEKDFLTSKDVIHDLESLKGLVGSDKLAKLVVELADTLNTMSAAVNKSTFVSNKSDIAKIEKCSKEIYALNEKITTEFSAGDKGKTNAHFTPLSASDKKKMTELTEDLLTSKQLANAQDKFESAAKLYASTYLSNVSTRLIGWSAEDLRKPNDAFKKTKEAFNAIGDIFKRNIYYCHGTVSYIAASTSK